MKKATLVAHGAGDPSFSIDKVKTITRAGENLSFADALEYMNSSKSVSEYASTGFGDFAALSDQDCKALFKNKIPSGNGIVSTGLQRGGDLGGPVIYALRGISISKDDIEKFIKDNSFTSLVLLACRGA